MKKLLLTFWLATVSVITLTAATITVTQITDNGTGATTGSLSWAINTAASTGDVIAFNLTSGDVVTLSAALPTIDKSFTMEGINIATGNPVTIQVAAPGVSTFRVFFVWFSAAGKTITLNDLILRGGDVSGLTSSNEYGGIIRFVGAGLSTYNLNRCVIRDGKAYYGGGIYHLGGNLTVNQCTLNNNTATSYGGGIYTCSAASSYTTVILNTTICNNSALSSGGGVYNHRPSICRIINSTISDNSGSGIYGNGTSAANLSYFFILNSSIVNNTPYDFNKTLSYGNQYRFFVWAASKNPYNNWSTELAYAPNSKTAYTAGDLGSLSNNGGPTPTMELSSSAPASQTGSYAYYNATDGYYFKGTDNLYYKFASNAVGCIAFTPSSANPENDKITTDQRGATRSATPSMGAFDGSSCTNPTDGGTIGSDQSICQGVTPTEISSTSLPSGHTGNLEFQWQESTTSATTGFSDITGANDTTYQPAALTATTWYQRLARVSCKTDWTGAAESNVVKVTIEPTPVSGSLSKTPNIANVCEGTDVLATLTSGSGGNGSDSLVYRTHNGTSWSSWINYTSGVNIVTTGKTSVEIQTIRKSDYCNNASANTVSWVVESPVTPVVSISESANNVVAGTLVTFTATPSNGGIPAYQWNVNGSNAGTGLSTYAYTPANGDVVNCEMTSSLSCVTSSTATSNLITMTVTSATPVTTAFTGTGNWNQAARWGNGIPGVNDHAVISGNLTITGAVTVASLTVENGASILGNENLTVTDSTQAKRTITPNAWHLMSSSVNGAKSNSFYNNNLPPVYLQIFNNDGTWAGITDKDYNLVNGEGYSIWADNAIATATFNGSLNYGAITVPVLLNTGLYGGGGFNLLGNPYPSAIDLDVLYSTNTQSSSFYTWNQANGQYSTYNAQTQIGQLGSTNIIPANQGFFVNVAAAGNYTFMDAYRTHSTTPLVKSTPANILRLNVHGNNLGDEAVITFNSNATNYYDFKFDSRKLMGSGDAPQLYTVVNGEKLSINSLSELIPNTSVSVPMNLEVGADGNYTITASELNSFTVNTTVYLIDSKTNQTINMSQNPVYNFTANTGDNANRFTVLFAATSGINSNNADNLVIFSHNNDVFVTNKGNETIREIQIMNALGQQVVKTGTESRISLNVETGYYFVKVITSGKTYTQKVFIH